MSKAVKLAHSCAHTGESTAAASAALSCLGHSCRFLGCEHCSVKASGTLLPSLALLDQLQELHLDRNWFNGTLPPAFAFGFPALVKLCLDYNSLTVSVSRTRARLEVLHVTGAQCIIVALSPA